MPGIFDNIKKGNMIKEEMQKDYRLIPMSAVSDEARLLAVAWHENATNWIGDKHKLASDIMNYARRANKELVEALEEVVRISDRKHDAWDKAKAVLKKVGR